MSTWSNNSVSIPLVANAAPPARLNGPNIKKNRGEIFPNNAPLQLSRILENETVNGNKRYCCSPPQKNTLLQITLASIQSSKSQRLASSFETSIHN